MTPKPQRTTRGISGGDAENPPSQPSNTAPTGENRGTTPQTGETEAAVEEGKDIHDSNGADGHRDKRQRRNRDASSRLGSGPTSELGPETEDRVYLELRTERAAPWVGPPMHNPELYERIQRDAEAGVYIGPGAGIVVRYTPQSQTALAAGGTPAPEGGRRAGDTAETAISVAGTSSDIDELPAIRKKRSREEERSGSGGDCHSKSDKGQGQERKEGTVGGNSSDSVTDDARERRYPRAEREGTVRRVGPALGPRIIISSDDSHRTEFVRNGDRLKDRAEPPSSPRHTPSPRNQNAPKVSYGAWYRERRIRELRNEFKRMGRRRLLRAFPLQKLPTRRTRTWCPSKISALGDFGITLASALPPRPQLTRPGRRVDLIYSERAPVVKLEAPTREIDPRQIPLPSIEEEPGSGHEVLKQERSQHHSTEVPPVEPQAEEPPKRARRQAAIACRQRMLERTAPPARRSTRGPAARKKSVASSHEPQASAPNDDGVTAPDAVPKEAEASGNQPEQTGRGRGRSRAPSKAPAKTRAKKAPVKKPPVKKPAPKPKSQPKSQPKGKATAKSKPVSKSGKASAPKKGK